MYTKKLRAVTSELRLDCSKRGKDDIALKKEMGLHMASWAQMPMEGEVSRVDVPTNDEQS